MSNETPRRLLEELLDRSLSPDELRSLGIALEKSVALRDRYWKLRELSADLEWEFGGPSPLEAFLPEAAAAQSAETLEAAVLEPEVAHRNRAGGAAGWRRPTVSFALGALAASLILVATAATLWRAGIVGAPGLVAQEPADRNKPVRAIATLTGVVDCQWADDFSGPAYGGLVTPGEEIRIKSGLAQLTFESGAKLVLEGPARFTPHEKLHGSLAYGRATAVVGAEATGFRVDTPTAEVIDLGTSFGVEVAASGDSEVHVLEGEVLTRPISEAGEADFVHLLKDMAVRITSEDFQMTSITPSLDRFIDDVRPQLIPDGASKLPVDRALALWLAADEMVEKDENGRVIAWNDILVGDNQSDEIAWQSEEKYRPRWIESAIGGKPAIRFSRDQDHLVTTPLATTNDQTVFLAFAQNHRTKPGSNRQLLNYNGPPVRYVEDLSEPGILQIDDYNEPGRFYAQVYKQTRRSRVEDAHNQNLVGFSVGEVSTRNVIPLGEAAVLGYIYSRRDNYSAMYLNGKLQSKSDAPFDIAVNSRKVIGKHGKPRYKSFRGDIAEVIIFNDRLSEREVRRVNRYLNKKYRSQDGKASSDDDSNTL